MNKRGTWVSSVTYAACVALGFVAPLFVSAEAGAQEWLKDRRYQEGAGIRTGDLELHPGIAGEMGYDSNWFLRTDKTGGRLINSSPVGTPMMRITPSLSLSTLSPQRREGDGGGNPPSINFRAGIAATYREFFGTLIPEQRNVSGQANARLEILPQRPWGAAIFGVFERTIQPPVLTGAPADLAFNRDDVGLGAEVIATPGGGTLDWRLGYQFRDTIFEDSAGTPYSNFTNEAFTRGRWKFRPKTALLYDATFRFINYQNVGTSGAAAGVTPLHDSTPVRARIGLNGLITPRFSMLAMAGYGASFYKTSGAGAVNVPQYDSIIGQAEAKFFLSAVPGNDQSGSASLTLSSLALGYVRDFQNSYLGDFYGSDRGYLKFSYFFAGRALVSLEGGVGAVEYPTLFFGDGTVRHTAFTDVRADATLFGEYRLTDSFGINTTLRYTTNISDQVLNIDAAGLQQYAMQWKRFEAFLGVRWFL